MDLISINTAMALTDLSERTLWRRFADGSIRRTSNDAGAKSQVYFESLKPFISVNISGFDTELIGLADAGDSEAQTDLALIFLDKKKYKSALHFLGLAAKQNYAPAMHWLGRCYVEGLGVELDENMGMMWICNAAAHGDKISKEQMQGMRDLISMEKSRAR